MTETKKTYKRSTYLIKKDFQVKFILKFCVLVVGAGLLTMEILYLLSAHSTTVSIVNSRVMVRTTADFLLPLLIQTVLIVTVIMGLATIALTLFFSHKIAGPLYRFKKVMETLVKGDFSSDFQIRHLDQLQDLADDFNKMISSVRQHLNLLKENVVSLKDKLNDLSEHEVVEHKRGALGELKKITEELNKAIHLFKS